MNKEVNSNGYIAKAFDLFLQSWNHRISLGLEALHLSTSGICQTVYK